MKKWIALLLSLAIALSFTACGGNGESTVSETPLSPTVNQVTDTAPTETEEPRNVRGQYVLLSKLGCLDPAVDFTITDGSHIHDFEINVYFEGCGYSPEDFDPATAEFYDYNGHTRAAVSGYTFVSTDEFSHPNQTVEVTSENWQEFFYLSDYVLTETQSIDNVTWELVFSRLLLPTPEYAGKITCCNLTYRYVPHTGNYASFTYDGNENVLSWGDSWRSEEDKEEESRTCEGPYALQWLRMGSSGGECTLEGNVFTSTTNYNRYYPDFEITGMEGTIGIS